MLKRAASRSSCSIHAAFRPEDRGDGDSLQTSVFCTKQASLSCASAAGSSTQRLGSLSQATNILTCNNSEACGDNHPVQGSV